MNALRLQSKIQVPLKFFHQHHLRQLVLQRTAFTPLILVQDNNNNNNEALPSTACMWNFFSRSKTIHRFLVKPTEQKPFTHMHTLKDFAWFLEEKIRVLLQLSLAAKVPGRNYNLQRFPPSVQILLHDDKTRTNCHHARRSRIVPGTFAPLKGLKLNSQADLTPRQHRFHFQSSTFKNQGQVWSKGFLKIRVHLSSR